MITEDIKARDTVGNRDYYGLNKMFKSRVVKRSKFKLYKTILKPFVIYGCEVWFESDRRMLNVCERKILRWMYGLVTDAAVSRIRRSDEFSNVSLFGQRG